MRILICGDVVGRAGRDVLAANLAELKVRVGADFTVVNAENAAHGFGLTRKITDEILSMGADVLTTGNHVWDQREIVDWIENEDRVIRPINYPEGTPGRGARIFNLDNGRRVMVVQPMGRLFMDPLDDPFAAVDGALRNQRLGRANGGNLDAVIVDFHAETTSEKMAMGHHLDGRVSVVVGTHTHVPTGDAQVLPGGTAYQTDLGMCGDYDSVIGMKKQAAIERFTRKMPGGRLEPAEGDATLCAVLVETDDHTGLSKRIDPIRIGGRLRPIMPDTH
ncbi:MAG: TIGR00282 family metallophosphoesterase [Rhodospirillales bacterium]